MFVWIWDERSLRSRRKSGARERAIETGLDASTMTDLAAVRSVDAGPYIVKECASRRAIAPRVIDSREIVMVVNKYVSLHTHTLPSC
jgi:hypothetical protein